MIKALLVTWHAHDECRKTNVVRVNILEGEQAGGRSLCQVGHFVEYRVVARQLLGAKGPAHVCIEGVASDFDIRSARVRQHCRACRKSQRLRQAAVLRAFVGRRRFKIRAEHRVLRVQQHLNVSKCGQVKVSVASDPEFDVFLVKNGRNSMAVRRQCIVVIARVHHPDQKQLPLIVRALNAARLAPGLRERRQQQASQNADDRNNHQQLDQRKSRLSP